MIYDSENKRIILFGGYINGNQRINDLWVYYVNNNTWFEITAENKPSKRYGHTMVYDRSRKIGLLFGGNDFYSGNFYKKDDTWSLDCNALSWTEINATSKPTKRYWHSMIYDDEKDKSVIFGGMAEMNIGSSHISYSSPETWIYDYQTNEWINHSSSHSPSPRFYFSYAHDSINQKFVIFGGLDETNILDDLWELDLTGSDYRWIKIKGTSNSPLNLPIFEISVISLFVIMIILSKPRKKKNSNSLDY
jgi:hypothetical protein